MKESSCIALFPTRIGRINYLVRSLLCGALVSFAGYMVWLMYFQQEDRMAESWLPILAVFFGACFVRLFCLDVPRMRSAGLNPWLLLLIFIPGVALVFQVLLLVMAPVPLSD